MTGPAWSWERADDPLLATAIHAGADLRPEVEALTALDEVTRRREEDPYTDRWTGIAGNRLVVHRSRWEVDVNRSRRRAVYLQPEDCWGLQPWRVQPRQSVLDTSYALYDRFYDEVLGVCHELERRHGCFVVLDLHSYNHRRLGPGGPAADPASNPEVNVGTSTMNHTRWRTMVDRYLADLAGAGLDARENVRFTGAELATRIHDRFPDTGCCLAVDVKKVFVDEHTGQLDVSAFERIHRALAGAVPGLRESLRAQA